MRVFEYSLVDGTRLLLMCELREGFKNVFAKFVRIGDTARTPPFAELISVPKKFME